MLRNSLTYTGAANIVRWDRSLGCYETPWRTQVRRISYVANWYGITCIHKTWLKGPRTVLQYKSIRYNSTAHDVKTDATRITQEIFNISYFKLHIAYWVLHTVYWVLHIPYYNIIHTYIAYCIIRYSIVHSPYFIFHIAYCILVIAYCILRIALLGIK